MGDNLFQSISAYGMRPIKFSGVINESRSIRAFGCGRVIDNLPFGVVIFYPSILVESIRLKMTRQPKS